MTSSTGSKGYFEEFGGRFVPETLMAALDEFEGAYRKRRRDAAFKKELRELLANSSDGRRR